MFYFVNLCHNIFPFIKLKNLQLSVGNSQTSEIWCLSSYNRILAGPSGAYKVDPSSFSLGPFPPGPHPQLSYPLLKPGISDQIKHENHLKGIISSLVHRVDGG